MTDSPRWPHRLGYFKLVGFVLSLIFFVFLMRQWLRQIPVVQRVDFPAYIHATAFVAGEIHTYSVVMRGRLLATSSDTGALTLRTAKYDSEKLRAWLQQNVYDGQPLWMVLKWPLIGFSVVFIVLVGIGSRIDRAINREAREGHLIRGPRIVSKWRWNLRTAGKRRNFYVETE